MEPVPGVRRDDRDVSFPAAPLLVTDADDKLAAHDPEDLLSGVQVDGAAGPWTAPDPARS